jgi:hypothetical protein
MGIMSFEPVPCPKCSSVEWKAVEQFTSLTPCGIFMESGEVVVEFDMRAEMNREASTSVTTAYICGNGECGYSFEPTKLDEMGGSND